MKKIFLLVALVTMSLASQAAFLRWDGTSTSTDLFVEFDGTLVGGGLDVTQPLLSTLQFQLLGLDESTDDLNSDGLLTVQFLYFDSTNTSLGFDPAGFSVLWSDINAAKVGAAMGAELIYASDSTTFLSTFGPLSTSSPTDYAVAALIEGTFFAGNQGFFIDFVDPNANVVSSPATLGLAFLAIGAIFFTRRKKA